MNEPKYKIGDRVGKWKITKVSYSGWLETWVYDLEMAHGRQKLTCSETTIEAIAQAFVEQN